MISVLFGKGLCSLGVHSVGVWNLGRKVSALRMGYAADAMPNVSKLNTTTEEKTAGEPKTPVIVVTSGRRAVGESPIAGLVARTAVVVMLVAAESNRENSAMK